MHKRSRRTFSTWSCRSGRAPAIIVRAKTATGARGSSCTPRSRRTRSLDEARRALRETAARQELARRTLEARRRPEVLALLDAHFARLELLDPERNFRVAIAAYPLDAIVDGIAIFEGKRLAKTLHEGVGARYLLGIVRNVAA